MKFFYKGFSKIPCIYEIKNIYSNRSYIGQTKEPKDRWHRGHESSLLKNKHKNQFLQNDYNKCFILLGNTDFLEFHIIEGMPGSTPDLRDEREQYWISQYKENQELYNLTSGGNARKNISKSTRQKLSDAKKGKTYENQYGEKRAAEIKQKIRNNKLIEMNRTEVKENLSKLLLGKNNIQRYGHDKAAEIKKKQSVARKGKYIGKENSRFRVIENIKLLSPEGIIYTKIEGIKEFAEEHSLSKHHLCELLSGKRRSHHGWVLVNDNNQ